MENCQILPWNEENLDWQIDCCFRVLTVFLISTLFYTFLFKNSKLVRNDNLDTFKIFITAIKKECEKLFYKLKNIVDPHFYFKMSIHGLNIQLQCLEKVVGHVPFRFNDYFWVKNKSR